MTECASLLADLMRIGNYHSPALIVSGLRERGFFEFEISEALAEVGVLRTSVQWLRDGGRQSWWTLPVVEMYSLNPHAEFFPECRANIGDGSSSFLGNEVEAQ